MPRFYSPEWVAAFNDAVAGLDVGSVDTGTSLAAESGRFRVAQVVRGGPEGPDHELVVTLVVGDGRVRLELDARGVAAGGDADVGRYAAGDEGTDGVPRPDVTVSLSYEDAAAMSRGELEPATAVGEGRVRVRGDLAVLLAGQSLVGAAAERLSALQAVTTY